MNSKYYIIFSGIFLSIALITFMIVIESEEVTPIVEEPVIKVIEEPIIIQQPKPPYENPLPLPVADLEDWEKCIADETHVIHNHSHPKICYTSDGLMAREALEYLQEILK